MYGSPTAAAPALERSQLADIADKRLAIKMSGFCQLLWRKQGQDIGDPRVEDSMPDSSEATEKVRWIDTDIMIVDPLIKIMSSEELITVLESNRWDLSQPVERVQKRCLKQQQRRKQKDEAG